MTFADEILSKGERAVDDEFINQLQIAFDKKGWRDFKREVAQMILDERSKVATLKSERDRLQEALKKIVSCHSNDECGFCGSLRIAKEALASGAGPKEGSDGENK